MLLKNGHVYSSDFEKTTVPNGHCFVLGDNRIVLVARGYARAGIMKLPDTAREPGWLPDHKWYDNTGPGASGDYHLPILGHTERRDEPGAKIYPFNPVTVDWFVKKKKSSYDDVIKVAEVKAADSNKDLIVTLEEMQEVYRHARLVTADMNFSISHSVVPANLAFKCDDCHGKDGWVLDWEQLGYDEDPRGFSI